MCVRTELLMPVQWQSQVVQDEEIAICIICTHIRRYVHTLVGKPILTDSSWTEWEVGHVCKVRIYEYIYPSRYVRTCMCVYRRLLLRVELTHLMWLGEGDGAWGRPCELSACTERYIRSKNGLGNSYPYPCSFLAHTTRVQQDVCMCVHTYLLSGLAGACAQRRHSSHPERAHVLHQSWATCYVHTYKGEHTTGTVSFFQYRHVYIVCTHMKWVGSHKCTHLHCTYIYINMYTHCIDIQVCTYIQ